MRSKGVFCNFQELDVQKHSYQITGEMCRNAVRGNRINAAMATKPVDTQGKGIVFADGKDVCSAHRHTRIHRNKHTHFFLWGEIISKTHLYALLFLLSLAVKGNNLSLNG